jgi:hypothetical protein
MEPDVTAIPPFQRNLCRAVLLALVILAGCVPADEPRLEEGRRLADQFGGQLKSALQSAMARGGPVAAVAVCKDQAPAIAAELSRASGADVRRVSRRVRNPANVADDWEIGVLEGFQRDLSMGKPPPEFYEETTAGARYMKAIAIQPLCLVCHGTSVSGPLADALKTHYPNDQATGYGLNDLRGAFSIAWRD